MTTKGKVKGVDLSGLDVFTVSSLLEANPPGKAEQAGAVSYASLERFHEDPENARQEFDQEALQELADSMKALNTKTGRPRGVLQPLSARRHPDIEGDFIINGGARRFRAAKIAGLSEVPYFLSDEADDYDKVVDNMAREDLSPLEIALFIQKRLKDGDKASEIAEKLGKQRSFVSNHVVFFEIADCIRELYDSGKCQSMRSLADLHRAYKKWPAEVLAFCESIEGELTAAQVSFFVNGLKTPKEEKPQKPRPSEEPENKTKPVDQPEPESEKVETGDSQESSVTIATGEEKAVGQDNSFTDPEIHSQDSETTNAPTSPVTEQTETHDTLDQDAIEAAADKLIKADADQENIKKAIIQVKHDERPARLLYQRRAAYGLAWIKYDDDGHEIEVGLPDVELVAVIEA